MSLVVLVTKLHHKSASADVKSGPTFKLRPYAVRRASSVRRRAVCAEPRGRDVQVDSIGQYQTHVESAFGFSA